MPEIMEPDVWQSSLLQERLERPGGEVLGVHRGADLRGKHEPLVPVAIAQALYLLNLACQVGT